MSCENCNSAIYEKVNLFFSVSDGAAALVLVSGETAVKLGLQVIAKISGYGDAAQVLTDSIWS